MLAPVAGLDAARRGPACSAGPAPRPRVRGHPPQPLVVELHLFAMLAIRFGGRTSPRAGVLALRGAMLSGFGRASPFRGRMSVRIRGDAQPHRLRVADEDAGPQRSVRSPPTTRARSPFVFFTGPALSERGEQGPSSTPTTTA